MRSGTGACRQRERRIKSFIRRRRRLGTRLLGFGLEHLLMTFSITRPGVSSRSQGTEYILIGRGWPRTFSSACFS